MRIRALVDRQLEVPAWLQWRVTNPFTYIRTQSLHNTQYEWYNVGNPVEADILVLPRLIVAEHGWPQTAEWFQTLKASGTKLVYDIDDDIFSESYISEMSKLVGVRDNDPIGIYTALKTFEQKAREAEWTMNQCDAVTVSTSALGAYVKTLTDLPIYVLNNALDVPKFSKGLKERIIEEDVTIGWAGGKRNQEDVEEMIEGWAMLTQSNKNVRFIIAGWKPKLSSVVEERTVYVDWQDTEKYASGMQVDIGCCSVSDAPFSLRKSPIKAWEYAIAGAMVIGSQNVYGREPTIPICETAYDWYQMLEYYVKHGEDRKSMAQSFQTHVLNYHDLTTEWHNWYLVYGRILNDSTNVPMSAARATDEQDIGKWNHSLPRMYPISAKDNK